jgi:multiple sugar transport system permease protein
MLNTVVEDVAGGSSTTAWLSSDWALPAVVLADVWVHLPLTTVVLLAALQNVPQELREAAALDRAGAFAAFRAVTWPVVGPTVAAITSLNLISSFNEFSLVYVMTNGSPSGALRLPMLLAYEEAFDYGDFGYAAALGNVMVLCMAVVLGLTFRVAWRRLEGD